MFIDFSITHSKNFDGSARAKPDQNQDKPKARALSRLLNQREIVGGPREGRGGAVTDAMCAATTGISACAKGEGCVNVVLKDTGGAVIEAHNGQSIVLLATVLSSSPCTTNFMLPVLVQTKSIACGCT